MRWLVISDTHLGSATCKRQKDLLELLIKLTPKFDTLVINGDFIDLWRKSYRKIVRNPDNKRIINYVFTTLPEEGKRVIYIFGNHEDTGEDFLQDKFPQIEMFYKWENTGITVTHGHQFHYLTEWKRFKGFILAKLRQIIESIFYVDLRELGMKLESFLGLNWSSKQIQKVHDEAIIRCKGRYKGIVIGHTHTHRQRIFNIHTDNFTLYDCGNSCKDLNYFLFDNDKILEVG